ncbi:MAG: 3-hydroxyacyl-ACP dehydratase FabZ [Ferrimicrobium sp.]
MTIDPTSLIPHRSPFLLVDRIDDLVPGERASGAVLADPTWPVFMGHFPGNPLLPGVYLVEAIAQLGASCILADARYAGRLPLFGGIDRARFRRQVRPGDEVVLEVTLRSLSARAGRGSGTARVEGELAAEVDIFFVIAPASVS